MSPDDKTPPNPASPEEAGAAREAPDTSEQEHPEFLDNIVPTGGYQMMPMVGLGASAGGIASLQEFFQAMPADSGMVFVVVMHLSPTRSPRPSWMVTGASCASTARGATFCIRMPLLSQDRLRRAGRTN